MKLRFALILLCVILVTTVFAGCSNDKKEDSTQSKEEQAIDAVKKQWGEDDSVTFSVERKKDTKYYVAVKSSNSETTWYEVDIETWEVEEY